MTVKLSHERKVRSLAKKTLGSTRVGRAIRLPGERGQVRNVIFDRGIVEVPREKTYLGRFGGGDG